MNKLHIMLDLETLGVKLLAPIVQIGAACAVESNGIWELKPMLHFNETIAMDDALEHRRPCASTLLWWMKQKESVRDSVLQEQGLTVRQALNMFTKFIHFAQDATASEEVYVWGNGASTDNAWLIGLYEQYGFGVPWKHWGNMCYRTVKNMNRHVPKPEMPAHLQHIAVQDAINQLNHLAAIMNDMRSKASTQSNS